MPNDATDPIADQPHLHSTAQVARWLRVDPAQGLAADEVAQRLDEHGPNALAEAAPRRWWMRLLAPLADVMTGVLLAAALVSGLLGDLTDTVVILVIVALNAGISILQEWQADKALAALKTLAGQHAKVRREGTAAGVDALQLVPGDVVLLEAGDLVPADLRLVRVAQLRVDESALTGESLAVEKHSDTLTAAPEGEQPLGERSNMAWKGTLVTHGRASGMVVATGGGTELGRIASLLEQAQSRSTPLQRRLSAFGRRPSVVVLMICVVVFAIGVLRGVDLLLMGLTAISLAVAAIPEALPAVVTVLLALGARRLARVHALVRHLPSVETLGSVTTICTDKTGTLTQNRMAVQVEQAWLPADQPEALWRAALLCNDARPESEGQGWLGEATELALAEKAEQTLGPVARHLQADCPRSHEWPFDADRKRMSVLVQPPAAQGQISAPWLVCKGAPESVLPRCSVAPADTPATARVQLANGQTQPLTELLAAADALAAQGMRVLAVAQRYPSGDTAEPVDLGTLPTDQAEQGLALLGLIGLIDPPRPEAAAAVAECQTAGIRTVMITGDHPATALAIARSLGLVPADAPATAVLAGPALAQMDDATLAAQVGTVAVYARMDPAQKIRIVQALQSRGEFVAMTGDGVNDAPALKAADIGVAMGQGGTDVAREAASLVLLDDNFATIEAAVREGRRIFDNIRKFIRYAMTGNSGEVWVLFLAPLLGLPIPLLPIHILWINLVTDGLPGLALAAEPAERGVMQRPPRAPTESVFAHGLWQHTLWVGLLIAGLCLGLQAWALDSGDAHWQTLVFTTLTITQMAHLLAIRSEHEPLWRIGLLSNRPLLAAVSLTLVLQLATVYLPVLQPIFRTQALSAPELSLCFACGLVVMLAVELEKAWRQRQAASLKAGAAGPSR